MEKMIKDIIDADRKARERLQQLESERYQLNDIINKQRKEITEKFEQISTQKKMEHKKELDAMLKERQIKNDQDYETVVHSLDEKFNKEKDTWVNEIYENCLGNS